MCQSVVYLLHFERPISPDHACQHYIGYSKNLAQRLACHRKGNSDAARLCQVAKERNIKWNLVRLWSGGQDLEKYLKSKRNGPKLCPICNPGTGWGRNVGQWDQANSTTNGNTTNGNDELPF